MWWGTKESFSKYNKKFYVINQSQNILIFKTLQPQCEASGIAVGAIRWMQTPDQQLIKHLANKSNLK